MGRFGIASLAMAGVLVSATVAAAGTVTFAQFEQLNNKRTFRYVNRDVRTLGSRPAAYAPGAEVFTIAPGSNSPDTVLIEFTPGIDGIAGSGIFARTAVTAQFTLSAVATGGVAASEGSFTQMFSGSMSFIDDSTGANLLTADFTNALIVASAGAFSFILNASSGSGTLDYTSDVFTFIAPNDFSISGSGTSTAIALAGPQPGRSLRSFNASVTGTLSTIVPEPAAAGLFGLGLIVVGARARQRRAAA